MSVEFAQANVLAIPIHTAIPVSKGPEGVQTTHYITEAYVMTAACCG